MTALRPGQGWRDAGLDRGWRRPEPVDPLPPAERLAALDMAIVNLEQANRAEDQALSRAINGTERALPTRGTDSPGGTLSCDLLRPCTLCISAGHASA